MNPDDILEMLLTEENAERAIKSRYGVTAKPGDRKGTPLAGTRWSFAPALLALSLRGRYSLREIGRKVGVNHPAVAELYRRFDAAEQERNPHGA